MTNESKVTARPWRLCDPMEYPWRLEECGIYGEPTVTILGANGYGIFSVPESITDHTRVNWDHMLRAVNVHDDLVAACLELRAAVATGEFALGHTKHLSLAADLARAALAKAGDA